MNKTYQAPKIDVVDTDLLPTLLSESGKNNVAGTIHGTAENEQIGVGKEDEDDGLEASAKYYDFTSLWD